MKRKIISAVAIAIMATIVSVIMVSCGAKKIKVTFDLDGGKIENFVLNQEINDNSKITKPADPVKENHEFLRWEVNGGEFNFDQNLQNDITIKAVYVKFHNVKFDLDEGKLDGFSLTQKVKDGQKISKPNDPIKAGYKFIQWELNEKEFNFDNVINSDVTLKAVYVKAYNVTFKIDGSDDLIQQVVAGEKVMKPQDPVKDGCKFDKWVNEQDESDFDFNSVVNNDITIKAIFVDLLDYEEVDGEYTASIKSTALDIDRLIIPEKYNDKYVTKLGTFAGLEKLTFISIPNTVKEISSASFRDLPLLKEYQIRKIDGVNEPKYMSENGVIFSGDKSELVLYPMAKEDEAYEVPETVTTIGVAAFKDMKFNGKPVGLLKTIVLPDNLNIISDSAFYSRAVLENVSFKNAQNLFLTIGDKAFYNTKIRNFPFTKVKSIGKQSFYGAGFDNENLFDVVLEKGLETIGAKAFYLSKIGSIKIPSTIKNLEEDKNLGVFGNCAIKTITFASNTQLKTIPKKFAASSKQLTNVVLPEGITHIGDMAFNNCQALTEINIPSTLKSIGKNVFNTCKILDITGITVPEECEAIKKIDNALYAENVKRIIFFSGKDGVDTFEMPNTVEEMDDRIFRLNTKTKKVVLSNKLKRISENAFDSSAIETIIIPASVTEIAARSFNYLSAQNVTIEFAENSQLTKIAKGDIFSWAKNHTGNAIFKINSEKVLNLIKNKILNFASEIHVPTSVTVPQEIKDKFTVTEVQGDYTIYKKA